MPSMLESLVQGVKNYKQIASYQLRHNIVAECRDAAEFRGTSPAVGVAKAIGAGAATFLAPPVVIGAQAAKDYREKRDAAMRKDRLPGMIQCLMSHGISADGAAEIASLVLLNRSTGRSVGMADYKMWKVVACVIDPGLERFTYRVVAHVEL